MGTWHIPYSSVEKAKRLKYRMSKPWIAKVTCKSDEYTFSFPDSDLIGDDHFYDVLADTAIKKKKDFDIRPLAKKTIIQWMKELYSAEDVVSLQAVNLTRAAVGMKPLDSSVLVRKNIRAAKKAGVKIKGSGTGSNARSFRSYLVRNKFRIVNMGSGTKISNYSDKALKHARLSKYRNAPEHTFLYTLQTRSSDVKGERERLKNLVSQKYKLLGVRNSLNGNPGFIDVIVTIA